MKTTIFYTVTFRAFLLANSSMAMSKFIVCQLLLYRQCGKISQSQCAYTYWILSNSWSVLVSKNASNRQGRIKWTQDPGQSHDRKVP